jgi:two-component system cell cycle sensor histidine kinase/response regulator CckA
MKPQKTILLVEDEDPIRTLATACLRRKGYRVLEARDPAEAAQHWSAEQGIIDLLFTDILMPSLSGPELASEFVTSRPELKVIFSTGSNRNLVKKTVHLVRHQRFLQKPYTPAELQEAVNAAFSAS